MHRPDEIETKVGGQQHCLRISCWLAYLLIGQVPVCTDHGAERGNPAGAGDARPAHGGRRRRRRGGRRGLVVRGGRQWLATALQDRREESPTRVHRYSEPESARVMSIRLVRVLVGILGRIRRNRPKI